MKCIIYDMNNEGEGVTKINDKVTFVPYTSIDDEVDVDIVDEKSKFYYAKINKMINPSIYRRVPKCKYYFKCGGCNIMHLKRKEELVYKQNKVISNLKKISNIDLSYIDIVSSDSYYYRNHVTVKVNKDVLGFYRYHSNNIVDINKCIIANEKINDVIKELRLFINKYKDNNIKEISIKGYNEILINIISDDFKLFKEFKNMVHYDSLYINDTYKDKDKDVSINLNNYIYKVGATSFFQKNTEIATLMYDYIKNYTEGNTLDLYSGTGSIGIYVSDKAKQVIGVEIIKEAVDNAVNNSKINYVFNTEFICGKVEDNIDNLKNADTIIIDPPRSGIDNGLDNLIKLNSKRIIYVSCNSTTLARDLNILKEYYDILDIKLFDMFPNTYHVETVCILERK